MPLCVCVSVCVAVCVCMCVSFFVLDPKAKSFNTLTPIETNHDQSLANHPLNTPCTITRCIDASDPSRAQGRTCLPVCPSIRPSLHCLLQRGFTYAAAPTFKMHRVGFLSLCSAPALRLSYSGLSGEAFKRLVFIACCSLTRVKHLKRARLGREPPLSAAPALMGPQHVK